LFRLHLFALFLQLLLLDAGDALFGSALALFSRRFFDVRIAGNHQETASGCNSGSKAECHGSGEGRGLFVWQENLRYRADARHDDGPAYSVKQSQEKHSGNLA
jgi:hypothetical protein